MNTILRRWLLVFVLLEAPGCTPDENSTRSFEFHMVAGYFACVVRGFALSEYLYSKALIEAERLGADDDRFSNAYGQLARVYFDQSKWSEIEKLRFRVLAIRENVLGPTDPKLADDLSNFAGIYVARRTYIVAARLLERALSITRYQPTPPWNPEIPKRLVNIYQDIGLYSEAEKLIERILSMAPVYGWYENDQWRQDLEQESGYPPGALAIRGPKSRKWLKLLARNHSLAGRHADAGLILERLVEDARKTTIKKSMDLSIDLELLIFNYEAQGRLAEAETFLKEVLKYSEPDATAGIRTAIVSYGNPLLHLAINLGGQGRHSEAVSLFAEWEDMWERLVDEWPDESDHYAGLDESFLEHRRYADVANIFSRISAIAAAKLGADHPAVASAQFNVARAYAALGRESDAVRLYNRAFEVLKRESGNYRFVLDSYVEEVANWLRSIGRLDEAASMDARARKVRRRFHKCFVIY